MNSMFKVSIFLVNKIVPIKDNEFSNILVGLNIWGMFYIHFNAEILAISLMDFDKCIHPCIYHPIWDTEHFAFQILKLSLSFVEDNEEKSLCCFKSTKCNWSVIFP